MAEDTLNQNQLPQDDEAGFAAGFLEVDNLQVAEYDPVAILAAEKAMQEEAVNRIDFEALEQVAMRAMPALHDGGYFFSSTSEGSVFAHSVLPPFVSGERFEHYAKVDALVEQASWSLLANMTPEEETVLFSGFQQAEQRLVQVDLAKRMAQGATYPGFRRIDRLGGFDVMTGEYSDMRWLEQNAISPDGGNYQRVMADVSNAHYLPALREMTGIDFPDMGTMWDQLLVEMQNEAARYGRDLNRVGILYFESGAHIAKDVEMPQLQKFLQEHGVAAEIVNQHDIAATKGSLGDYDVTYRAFDTSRLLTKGGLEWFAQQLTTMDMPMVGRPSETVFGAKALMGILSRAARTEDPRLTPEQRQAVNEAMGWKDAFHSEYMPTIVDPEGNEVFWEDFLRAKGREVYLKSNMGGSGYAVLRIDGNEVKDEEDLIKHARVVMEQQGYGLEIEGMVRTDHRKFVHSVDGKLHAVNAASDYTAYSVAGQYTNTGFGRYNIVAAEGDDPRQLKNVTQGGGFSNFVVLPKGFMTLPKKNS